MVHQCRLDLPAVTKPKKKNRKIFIFFFQLLLVFIDTQSTPSDATTMPQGTTQSGATTQPGDTSSGSTMTPVPQSTTPAAPGTVPNECGCQHGGICRGPTPDGGIVCCNFRVF